MSSTSSSGSDYDEYCQYPYGFDSNYYGSPFQSRPPPVYSMGNPLVYYAQVQHQPMPNMPSSRESRKGNRNYFMRAFRWYTQEHVPVRKSPNISGFATWLDAKYGEYLRDSRFSQLSQAPLDHKQTPTPDTEGIGSDLCNACCANKKNGNRMQSPWGKRRRESKDAGDVVEKPKKSFLFIMHPKDTQNPASECCRTTPTSMHKISTATLISSETSVIKGKMKSQSLTYCCQQKESVNKSPAQDGNNNSVVAKLKKKFLPEAKETKIINPKQVTSKKKNEISCLCYEDKVVNKDTETQYEKSIENLDSKPSVDKTKAVLSKSLNIKQSSTEFITIPKQQKDVVTKRSVQQTSTQCSEKSIVDTKVDAHSQYQTKFWVRPNNTSQSRCACDFKETQSTSAANAGRLPVTSIKETGYTRTIIFKRPILVSDAAQTSDHSIKLEKETDNGYPLFLKIVRADKLN